MRLLDLWECGYVPIPEDPAIKDKVIISLFQALTKVLQSQNQDGSWGDGGCETTAYAVITLSKLYSLSSAPRIKLQVAQAIETGRKFLVDNSRAFPEPDRVWKGKTESGNGAIYQAHILAALHAPLAQQQRGPTIETHFDIPLAKTTIQTKYYARQAWLVDVPEWLLQASIIESHLLLPQIRDVRYAVFPSDSLAPDQYFESIPFAWTVANNSNKLSIGTEFMYQMMIVSMLDRQLEDYMENVVGKAFAGCLFEVEDIIYGIFYELELEDQDRCFCDSHPDDSARFSTATTLSDVRSVLYRFISHILNHPYVLMASFQDQSQLRSELLSFLLSRVSQLSGEQNAGSAVDKTAHPYTYAFLACLVGDQSSGKGVGLRRDFLKTPEQQYLAADLCRHMSIISFMSSNVEQQQQKIEVSPVSAKSRGSSFSAKYHRHAFSRSISSASTTSSVYDDSMSPVSSISSVSTSPTGSASGSFFTKAPVCQATHPSSFITQESMQISRILDHERRCLGLCLDGLLDAGIDQRTNNVLRLFVDASALSEQILRDPNIGTTCDNVTTPAKPAEASILNPPPVPPKRKRRSVSAARAAINVEPLVTQQETQKASEIHENQHRDAAPQVHKYQDVHHTPPEPTLDSQVPTPILMERDWSWSKQPSFPVRRSSRAGSEVSRIESIMSEIDGIKLDTNPKFNSNSFMQRRTACEGDAIWTQPKIPINTQKHLINCPPADTETIKLAKARLETQRRLKYDAQKKTATYLQRKAMAEVASVQTNAATARTQTKATEDSHKQEAKRRATYPPDTRGWVKAPPPLPMDSMDVQAKKLQRASKWGGPKWKAPF